jgi:sulfite exporter TauE/SafE
MRKHRTVAGVLQIVFGLGLLAFAGLLFAGKATGLAFNTGQAVVVVTQEVATSLGVILTALALGFFASAFGLLENLRWSRPVAWVMSIVGLFIAMPVGTVINAYVIWVLVKTGRGE